MQQSQKQKAIEYLFTSNKEKELSYSKIHNLISEDKITSKYRSLIEEKYLWFEAIEWTTIYNQIWNVSILQNLYYRLRWVNFYKKSLTNKSRLGNIENWTKLKTIFKLNDSELFLNSILEFIDKEKESWVVYKEQEQISDIQKDINDVKGKFDIFKFPLSYDFWKYLFSHNQYYKTLKLLQNQYKIEDIQIYQWKITFILSENKDKEVNIEFDWKKIYIDKKAIYFKYMKTWNTTKDLFILVFSYFTENKVNRVDFDSLEKYYKDNKEKYKSLEKTKFYDEWVRWYFKAKNICLFKEKYEKSPTRAKYIKTKRIYFYFS